MSSDDRIVKNSARCRPNKLLEFRGAVAVDSVDRQGYDVTYLDLRFAGPSDRIDIRLKSPQKSYKMREIQANELGCLMEALSLSFGDIPPARGGWEEMVELVIAALAPHKLESLYAKLTVNEQGYIVLGEGKCFSTAPDMEYTDQDLRFLRLDAIEEPTDHEPLTDEDLPF